jgi:hypothetical protein
MVEHLVYKILPSNAKKAREKEDEPPILIVNSRILRKKQAKK